MLYHNFYNKGIDWIGEMIVIEKTADKGNFEIDNGLNVSAFKPDELVATIETAIGLTQG